MSVLDVESEEDACEDHADCGADGHGEEEADGDDTRNDHLEDGVRRGVAV